MNDDTDFYVGYLPHAPTSLRHFLKRIVLTLGLLVMTAAVLLAVSQMPFARSYFEFGNLREFQGTLMSDGYPRLLVQRPGQADATKTTSEYLLVAPGKHGAEAIIQGFLGKEIRLRGQLIYRETRTMIEVEPGSIMLVDSVPTTGTQVLNLGPVTLTGEIVDSKCYLGVMNPGNGKVHRDCASRCLSGGIPPLFVEQTSGRQFLLLASGGNAIPYESIKAFVAEPVKVRGELLQKGDVQLLKIDPQELQHTD